MPKFKFDLDALLKIRRQEEQRLQIELAALVHERVAIETELRRHDLKLREGRTELRAGLTGHLDVSLLRQHAVATRSGQRRAQQAVLRLAGLQRKIDSATARVAVAARKRRALELLRERRHLEWRQSLEKREQAALDDLVGTRIAANLSP